MRPKKKTEIERISGPALLFPCSRKKNREKRRGVRSANFEQASISPHEIGGKVDYRSFFPFFLARKWEKRGCGRKKIRYFIIPPPPQPHTSILWRPLLAAGSNSIFGPPFLSTFFFHLFPNFKIAQEVLCIKWFYLSVVATTLSTQPIHSRNIQIRVFLISSWILPPISHEFSNILHGAIFFSVVGNCEQPFVVFFADAA